MSTPKSDAPVSVEVVMNPSQYTHFLFRSETLVVKSEELLESMKREGAVEEVLEQIELLIVQSKSVRDAIKVARAGREEQMENERAKNKAEREAEAEARRAQSAQKKQERAQKKQALQAQKDAAKKSESKPTRTLVPTAGAGQLLHEAKDLPPIEIETQPDGTGKVVDESDAEEPEVHEVPTNDSEPTEQQAAAV